MVLTALGVLERARIGVSITHLDVGRTPVVRYEATGAAGPVVVLAHGFAGSQQMMQGYALPLAQAGYRVFAFDFLGHGRHNQPMSGDVTAADGTTALLVAQTQAVMNAVGAGQGPIAVIGHSMATDVLARVANTRSDVGPVVLISAFSNAIDASGPHDLLLVTGAWEPHLRQFARERMRMIDSAAQEGDTVTHGSVTRRAIAAPWADHVSILHSRKARQETVAWLDRFYDRTSHSAILPTGWAILGVLCGLVMLFCHLCRYLPDQRAAVTGLGPARAALVVLAPMLIAPLCAVALDFDILPVLVADYLVLHMLIFGGVQLALMRLWGMSAGPLTLVPLGALVLVLACAVFGFTLDRYAANFWPTLDRVWIIGAMLIGAVPYMLADAILTAHQSFLTRLSCRAGFLCSLGIAVVLDPEGLFFLILIAPVLILFYLVFSTMGRAVSRRSGPVATGLALGLVLAWALGVSFPLFES